MKLLPNWRDLATKASSLRLVEIAARVANGHIEICVSNGGNPIPDEALSRLFQPFRRGELGPGMQGLVSAFTSPRRSRRRTGAQSR